MCLDMEGVTPSALDFFSGWVGVRSDRFISDLLLQDSDGDKSDDLVVDVSNEVRHRLHEHFHVLQCDGSTGNQTELLLCVWRL